MASSDVSSLLVTRFFHSTLQVAHKTRFRSTATFSNHLQSTDTSNSVIMAEILYELSPLNAIAHLALAVRCNHDTRPSMSIKLTCPQVLHLHSLMGSLSRLLPPAKPLSRSQAMGRLPPSIRVEQYPRSAPIQGPRVPPQIWAGRSNSPGRVGIYRPGSLE